MITPSFSLGETVYVVRAAIVSQSFSLGVTVRIVRAAMASLRQPLHAKAWSYNSNTSRFNRRPQLKQRRLVGADDITTRQAQLQLQPPLTGGWQRIHNPKLQLGGDGIDSPSCDRLSKLQLGVTA